MSDKKAFVFDTNFIVQNKKLTDVIDKLKDSYIRIVEYNNHFGDECWERTFSTSKLLDKDYVQLVFEGLDSAIKKHFLESSIKATEVLEYDNRIENGNIEIPIKALEELKKLYDEIKTRYPKYLDPLFEATAKILNSNYIEPKQLAWEDDLPF